MTPERWKKIKALFSSAQDCPESERDEFLIRACGGDHDLKSEIERLLDASKDDSFMESSAMAEAATMFSDERDGEGEARFADGSLVNDRYEIVRVLGRGGMGEVYLANDKRINRSVALKIIHTDLGSSKEGLRRFALEAQAISALNHPHIMTIYEFDNMADGSLFIVSEYIDGKTLKNLIGSSLNVDRSLDIAIQVSSALSAAHEAGITHRDIKPENIMVRPDGYIKVLDFGLAKLTLSENKKAHVAKPDDKTKAQHKTRPGAVMGTAAYMSPEQARGINVDQRTDIWSLGVVIYEMLTGKRPFEAETSADTMVAVLLREPTPMSEFADGIPAELDWIVSKALTKNVEARYQTTKELRADLEKIRKQIDQVDGSEAPEGGARNLVREPTADDAARDTDDGREMLDTDASPGPTNFSFTSFIREPKRHKVGISIVGVVLLSLISGIAYWAMTSFSHSERIDSLAVLPFENPGNDPELTYLSEGLSDTLIDRFAMLPQLRVVSRSSSVKFRGSDLTANAIASQLGARAIVTGTVERVGDELSVRFEIVDAVADKHLAGGSFRRKGGNIAGLQNEIAQAAVEQLKLKLTGEQKNRISAKDTENSEAFRYYLNGLVNFTGGDAANERALEYFQKAVDLDPNFAEAYAQIGMAYFLRANANDDPSVFMPKAKQAIERSLIIDPDLARAHTVQAMIREYEFDWAGAEREYIRGIDLSPNLDFARINYAYFLSTMNRQDEALLQLDEQASRDPLNRRLFLSYKGGVLVAARRFDEALQVYGEAQTVEPSNEVWPFTLGYAYAGKAMYREAATYYERAVNDLGGKEKYSQPLVYLAATYAKIPDKQNEAREIVKRIESNGQYSSPALMAAAHSALGDKDRAMELLEKAYIRHDVLIRYIGVAYEYDGLREDPRFKDLLKRMNLPE